MVCGVLHQLQSNIGISGVTSRVVGEWDNVRSVCIYKKAVKIKSYRELGGNEK